MHIHKYLAKCIVIEKYFRFEVYSDFHGLFLNTVLFHWVVAVFTIVVDDLEACIWLSVWMSSHKKMVYVFQ